MDEVVKLEIKIVFYFKNTKEDNIMTEEGKENFEINNICRFCENNIESEKV